MIYAFIVLYLLSGFGIWSLGTKEYDGGARGYMLWIEENFTHPQLMYILAEILVIVFWPYFIIRGIINKDE